MTVRGAVYHGFRAPTLNEFYRNFSAGNTLTRANEALGPERMTGGDAGVLIGNARASARITGFWNRLDNAITAITHLEHADADHQTSRERRSRAVERRRARGKRARDERAYAERGDRCDERALHRKHDAARQPRAAGAVAQPGRRHSATAASHGRPPPSSG